MPREWSDLNKIVSNGGAISTKTAEAQISLEAWHQETREVSLILSRMTGARVTEKILYEAGFYTSERPLRQAQQRA